MCGLQVNLPPFHRSNLGAALPSQDKHLHHRPERAAMLAPYRLCLPLLERS